MNFDLDRVRRVLAHAVPTALADTPVESVEVRPYREPEDPLELSIDVTVRFAMSKRPVPHDIVRRVMDVVFEEVAAVAPGVFPYVFCKFAKEQQIEAA